jgi:transposase
LFAALDYLSGKVFPHTAGRHRHQEWLAFLRKIEREVSPELDIHIICDNYATHKHPKVIAWLKRHARFHLHLTPTSSSWLNLVERFFGEITPRVMLSCHFECLGASRRRLNSARKKGAAKNRILNIHEKLCNRTSRPPPAA